MAKRKVDITERKIQVRERLQELNDQLTDLVVETANPNEWHRHGVRLNDLSNEDLKRISFQQKTVNNTLSIMARVAHLIDMQHDISSKNELIVERVEDGLKKVELQAAKALAQAGITLQ